jgi:SAM-dependent methyltransferase
MYIITGKGSVAGVDLAACVLAKCQKRGVLFDDDFPQYTLDFLTQIPSVSKSLREGKGEDVLRALNQALEGVTGHDSYMLLCMTAHKFINRIETGLKNVNLWDSVSQAIRQMEGKIAYLGTFESIPDDFDGVEKFALCENHIETMGNLILSIKRGYAELGENYAAHPKKLLRNVHEYYAGKSVNQYLLACTDLHVCKKYLMEFGIPETDIVDVIELAADRILELNQERFNAKFMDAVSDAKTIMRYRNVSGSDSTARDQKTADFLEIINKLPDILGRKPGGGIEILDIGASSSNHASLLANCFPGKRICIRASDISEASINRARSAFVSPGPDVTAEFVVEDVRNLSNDGKKYDVILCLGLLVCIANDEIFENIVKNFSKMMRADGILITRDALSPNDEKVYMDFGGVIRSESFYDEVFRRNGFELSLARGFTPDVGPSRKVRTSVYRRSDK